MVNLKFKIVLIVFFTLFLLAISVQGVKAVYLSSGGSCGPYTCYCKNIFGAKACEAVCSYDSCGARCKCGPFEAKCEVLWCNYNTCLNDVYYYDPRCVSISWSTGISCGFAKEQPCTDYWRNNYRCSGSYVQREYISSVCLGGSCYNSSVWYDVQYCGSSYYYEYQNVCTGRYVLYQYRLISEGCSGGSCYTSTGSWTTYSQTDCGTSYYEYQDVCSTDGRYVLHQRRLINKGCSNGSCYTSTGSWTTTSQTDCGADSGWYNIGSSYACCENQQYCTNCQNQEYRNYVCSANNCLYDINNTQTVKSNCSYVDGQCGYVTNEPPYIEDGSQEIDYRTYCTDFKETGYIGFSWIYRDDDGDNQSRFDFRVSSVNNVNTTNPEVDRTFPGLNNPDGTTNNQVVSVVLSPEEDKIIYGKTYYWWVRVWDDQGNNSGWMQGLNFNTTSHAYPWIDFSWSPEKPSVNEVVEFIDKSEVYGGTTKLSWYWEFPGSYSCEEPEAGCENIQKPSIKFLTILESQDNKVYLRVTDSDGFFCPGEKEIIITLPLPEYKEVPPVAWLKKIFAGIVNFFNGL